VAPEYQFIEHLLRAHKSAITVSSSYILIFQLSKKFVVLRRTMLKALVKGTLHSMGFDLLRYRPLQSSDVRLARMLVSRKINLIFDIGANIGQFAGVVREHGYRERIVSFEPLTSAWGILKESSKSDSNWEVAPRMAIGNADGETEIHVSANSYSSSVLGRLRALETAAPESRYVSAERTPLRRLDSVAAEYIRPGSKLFLKIDTQGFETQVLEGAVESLKHAVGLHIEVSFVSLYEGQALFPQISSLLRAAGFEMWDMTPNFYDPTSLRMLQGDAVFFRS
jgi:FkbM family methyltransferase